MLSNSQTIVVGLTATPGRHHVGGDDFESVDLANFYNDKKIAISKKFTGDRSAIQFLQDAEILSRVDHRIIRSRPAIELDGTTLRAISQSLDIPDSLLKKLGADHQRTFEVFAAIQKLVVEQKKLTLVFCPSKQNALDLVLMLKRDGCNAEAITGDTPITDRRDILGKFKSGEVRVVTNYGVLTTGFDAPKIDAVVIARPTTSVVLYSQMIGRGLRGSRSGGTERCTLVDVIDNIENMPPLAQASHFFDKLYEG